MEIKQVAKMLRGQDGVIWGNELFRFEPNALQFNTVLNKTFLYCTNYFKCLFFFSINSKNACAATDS